MSQYPLNPKATGTFILLALALLIAAVAYYSASLFSNKEFYNIMFRTNTAGLDVGAPVVLQGVKIGQVTQIMVGFNDALNHFDVQVGIKIDRSKVRWPETEQIEETDQNLRKSLIGKGMRAKLAMHSLITGKLMVQVGFFPQTALVLAGLENEIPSIESTGFNKLMEDIASIDIKKLSDRIDSLANSLERLMADGGHLIHSMEQVFDAAQIQRIENELLATLTEVRSLVDEAKPLTHNLNHVIGDTRGLVKKLDTKVDVVSDSVVLSANEIIALAKLLKQDLPPILDSLETTVSDVESMVKKGSPIRVELINALRNVNKTTLSLYNFANFLERHPDALLKGKH